jgi:type III secretory pathway component EscU
MMKRKEIIMRKMALSEDEAKEQLKKLTGNDAIKTLAEEITDIKEALGLPQNKA